MARALVKDAELILFDEPLVNLDYKLREELRQEMRELFQARHTIAVYDTPEPNEALALGGTATIMTEGRVIQSGKSARSEVRRGGKECGRPGKTRVYPSHKKQK